MGEEQEMQCRERSVKIPTRTHSSNASNRPTDSALKSFERASMATPQVRRSIDFSYGAGSTTQLCLKKILNIIATHSPSLQLIQPSKSTKFDFDALVCEEKSSCIIRSSSRCGKRGLDIDLNLRLGLALDSEPKRAEHEGFSACSSVGEAAKNSEGECDAKETVNSSRDFSTIETREEEETNEFSEITNLQVQTPEIDEKKKKKTQRSEGYLGLLVEAARLISGNLEDGEDRPIQSDRSRAREEYQNQNRNRNELWRLELCDEGLEDVSPVVRSKRGRNQVLPYRYRDSVLEPLKRLCSSSKQRSSSPRVSAKQRRNRNKLQTRC
ncbi:hypothetical protein Syun_000564 [Stephania yunnanensis]|uniref:Uncharacterized protein n=1 Tax=Stephania yunnanensis TaxID=152371 RepID=A0AAP0LHS4_9MAGN